MLRDKIIAAIRTASAAFGTAVVLWVVAQLANLGVIVKVDEEWSTVLAGLIFAIAIALYNFVVQWLTENVWGGFGWLLGVNKAPAYVEADLRSEPEGVAVDEPSALPQVSGGEDWHSYKTPDKIQD